MVFAFYQSTRILLGGYVTQLDVVGQGAEQRDPVSNEHWNTGNGEVLNHAGAQEALNRNAAVNIEMMGAASGQFCHDLRRRSRHLFHYAFAHGGEGEGPTA